MTAGVHQASTAGGPQARWGICTCGWSSTIEHRGAQARENAFRDAMDHIDNAYGAEVLEQAVQGGGR